MRTEQGSQGGPLAVQQLYNALNLQKEVAHAQVSSCKYDVERCAVPFTAHVLLCLSLETSAYYCKVCWLYQLSMGAALKLSLCR